MKIYLYFILVILLGCAKSSSDERNEGQFYSERSSESNLFSLERITTITLQDLEESIGAPLYQLEIDSDNNLYLFDTVESKFIKYDSTGKFLKTLGRMGRGYFSPQ